MQSLVITAPAKINLFLGVGALGPDGFHAVQTVLHTLDLSDTVTLSPADALTLTCDVDLGIAPERNLAYRAAEGFASAFGVDVLLDIHIVKRIPSGAGLGGGSSDAAAVLAGLASWAALPLDEPRLLKVAAGLGADVPFLLRGGAALMSGRGDRLTAGLPPLQAQIALVKPPASVPTGDAYHAFDAAPVSADDVSAVAFALRAHDLTTLAAVVSNNLTSASAGLVPEIAEGLAWLSTESGVLAAQMAGSGSALFAICEDAAVARRIADEAVGRGWWGAATHTSDSGPVVSDGEVLS